MRHIRNATLAVAGCLAICQALAQESPDPALVKQGAALYEQNCSACHGTRMLDPQGAFDLRTFPRDQKTRFVTSVAKGKNQMPPWGDLFSARDIEALWAYVIAGER
ncbi:MAG: c-type cytochrome [Rhodospirillaceae bacterium]